MHHLAIDRSTQRAWITVIALEGCLDAEFFQTGNRSFLKIESCDARLDQPAHQLKHITGYFARAAHLFDFLIRLEYDSHCKTRLQPEVRSSQFAVFSHD